MSKLAAKKTIIFDFDGTIGDSLHLIIDLFNKIGEPQGTIMTLEMAQEYRKLSAFAAIKKAHIPLWKVPKLRTEGIRAMHERIGEVVPFAGLPPVLRKLAETYQLIILTSNSVENVNQFLETNELSGCFESVHTVKNLFGKDRAIRRVLSAKKLDLESAIYIGDEVRDVQAAHRVGLQAISVSWGYNDHDLLARHNPEVLVDKPSQLVAAVARLL